jgi:hypothetical protein
MRLGRLGAWTSLAGLGAVLTVVSGCQMLPEQGEEGEGGPQDSNWDPSRYMPGTDPNTYNPGPGPYTPGPSAPVVRRLALDLSGVAGFAILDDDSEDGTQMMSAGLSAAAAATSVNAGGIGAAMYLQSAAAGQVLVRQIDRSGLERMVELASAADPLGMGSRLLGVSQEDPGAIPPPPSVDPSAPAPAPVPDAEPGTDGSGDANVGEQAGLLKITEEGEIVPALVALEPEPVDGADAPAPDANPEDPAREPDASDGPTEPAPTEPAPMAPPTGSGGTSGSGTAPDGAPPPPPPPGPRQEPLPRVTALGLSPDGSVYVLFQHGFIYRQPTAEEAAEEGFDPYSPQSPYRCQLFRADGSWSSGAGGLAQLECVTNQYEVPTWDTRRVMQFDASGKLYFRAVTPANPQGVFLQFDPVTKSLSEKVNANICWRDVQVTPRGSLFYTGSTGSGTDCSGTSFFRYVSADNRLTEIARDWWNFKYLAEQDPEDPNNERIIFYGPDPNSTSGFSWDSACLYRYNPAIATPAERTQKLVECHRDGWTYVNGQAGPMPMPSQMSDEEIAAFQTRCESEGQLFIGGEGVSALSQLEDGTLFVVGKFQRKLAGELGCGLDVQVDHCATLGTGAPGDALDAENTTREACELAGHAWVPMGPSCSNPEYTTFETCVGPGVYWNPGGGFRHYEMTGSACAVTGEGFAQNHLECHGPGQQPGGFSQEVNGLGYLVEATDSTPAHIELLSDPAERVERYWPVPGADGAELFYSVYNGGQYNLRVASQVVAEGGEVTIERRSLLDDYEVYNLQRDPSQPNRILFDALQFSTNTYLFGSIDPSLPTPEEVQASLEVVSGVSGRVETLIVLPNF